MKHQTIECLASLMGIIGFVGFMLAVFFVAIDVIDVYLKFRKHVLNGDLSKRNRE